MELSEKILALRKSNGLTQEQLAEKVDVSRQAVSKWESGQAVPEPDKIVALSIAFDVTTDYLLKSSEIDDLSVKTEMLQRQQQQMLLREEKNKKNRICILYSIAMIFIFMAVYFIEHYYFFEFGNPSVIFAEFLIFAAITIFICVKVNSQKRA